MAAVIDLGERTVVDPEPHRPIDWRLRRADVVEVEPAGGDGLGGLLIVTRLS